MAILKRIGEKIKKGGEKAQKIGKHLAGMAEKMGSIQVPDIGEIDRKLSTVEPYRAPKKRTTTQPKKKRTTQKKYKNAAIFVVHGSETEDGKHTVYYSVSGDLNAGRKKKFTNWQQALKFAREKARQWGVKVEVSR